MGTSWLGMGGSAMTDLHHLDGSESQGFSCVLASSMDALAEARGRFCVIGGLASAVYGRPRWTKDIDLYCRCGDAFVVLELLARAGFVTEETNPYWIFKAFRDGVQIDVIFKTKGDLLFDDATAERIREVTFEGVSVPVIAPEDLVVMKAVADDEASNRHWHDALGLLRAQELDWDYLLLRARCSPHRVLSLLHYALSVDVPVPVRAVRALHDAVDAMWP
jgi:predicted nucleotidyltransferase